MIKKTINYVDEFGEQATLEAWFHLTKKQALTVMGGISQDWDAFLEDIKAKRISFKSIISFADELILTAFGIREDGRYKKTPELRMWFENSEAYSKFFMQMMNTEEGAKEFMEFMEALTPKDDNDRIAAAKQPKPTVVKETPDWAK